MRLTASRASITSSGGAALDAIQQEDPTLDLNFEETKTLTDDVSGNNLITFSRASSGTYVDSDGLIKTSPVNLLTYSEEFDQANWANRRTTDSITAETLDPLGGSSATKLVDSIDNNTHRLDKISVPLSGSTSYTFSVFAKSAEYSHISLSIGESSNFKNAVFDIGAGTVVSTTNGYTGSIELVGNGWYRCSATVTLPSSVATQAVLMGLMRNATAISFAGDGSSGVYIWGAQLVEEGTTATDYIPTGATISGAPRFDHDPVTGKSLGLLIEESRTNTALGSDVVAGSPLGSNIIQSLENIISPRGVSESVRKLSRGSSSPNIWRIGSTGGGTPNTTYAISFWAKTVNGGTTSFNVDINDSSPVGGQSTTVDGEWKRYVKVGGARNEVFRFFDINMLATTDPIYIWGAQIEAGSFPTSYIPTSGSTVTRSPDLCTIEGTNFSSWYNQSEGTVFVEANGYPHPVSGKALVALAFSDNTYDNRITLAGSTGSDQFNFDVTVGGSQQRAILGNFVSSGLKSSGGYKSTGSAGSLDGAAAVTSNTPNIPSVISQLDIGQTHNGSNFLNGHISRLAYFPPRLPDATQQNITS
jgi:hypothetical protein